MKKSILHLGQKLLMLCIAVVLCCEAVNPQLLRHTAAVSASAGAPTSAELAPDEAQQILRLHVVANSDSEEDQRVKLLVRDALIQRFAPANSLAQAEELLLLGGGDVQSTVDAVLRQQGCGYNAQLRFGTMEFPEKSYAGVSYPAGEYEALRVELGAAAGQNWWCVLFPPICLVDIGVTDLPDTDELVFESDLLALLHKQS